MKPGDHPEFFQLPPPPGRSRESRIVLDRSGRFWNDGILVEHEGMVAAFVSWIRHHPDDGRLILTNGYDWTYFTAEDAPFVVKHVELGAERATLRLSGGLEEPLVPAAVEVSAEGVLYARIRGGAFEARFLPAAQAEMVGVISEAEDGSPVVEMAGQVFPIKPRQSARLAPDLAAAT
jgi:hypothetical protein